MGSPMNDYGLARYKLYGMSRAWFETQISFALRHVRDKWIDIFLFYLYTPGIGWTPFDAWTIFLTVAMWLIDM